MVKMVNSIAASDSGTTADSDSAERGAAPAPEVCPKFAFLRVAGIVNAARGDTTVRRDGGLSIDSTRGMR